MSDSGRSTPDLDVLGDRSLDSPTATEELLFVRKKQPVRQVGSKIDAQDNYDNRRTISRHIIDNTTLLESDYLVIIEAEKPIEITLPRKHDGPLYIKAYTGMTHHRIKCAEGMLINKNKLAVGLEGTKGMTLILEGNTWHTFGYC